ncbi:MAG: tetratricopeptide repeat protein [Gemmatimonadaceae bacterium]|nr:tetratricopeptide repeat protein [Gemmatimonadaceae bacterium]
MRWALGLIIDTIRAVKERILGVAMQVNERHAPRAVAAGQSASNKPVTISNPPAGLVGSRSALLVMLVMLVTVLAFWPSLSNGFVSLDDDENFLSNPHYRGLALENLRWMWTSFHLGTWIPLSWMTLGLDYVLWEMNPVGYHAVNVLLQAANAGMVYLLALRLLPQPLDSMRANIANRSPWSLQVSAVFVALLFAIHPLRVESVTWITERRDVLSGFFYFSTIFCFVRFAERGARARRWYVASVVTFALALLAKGTAVTVPGVLLVLWIYPFRQLGGDAGWGWDGCGRAVRVLSPFVLLSLAFTVVVFVALQDLEQLPVGGKIAVSATSWCFYVGKTLLPLGLSPLYAMPDAVNPMASRFLISYAIVALLAMLSWAGRRRFPGAITAVVLFTVIVFPLLGVHQGGPQIYADRNSFNASPALAMLAGGALLLTLHRSAAVARLSMVVAVGVVFGLATLTWQQAQVWRDSESLWTRVLEIEPDSPFGHNDIGSVRLQQGRTGDAIGHFERAVQLRPQFAHAWANLGVALAASERSDEAITAFRKALSIDPSLDQAEGNLGVALMRRGDVDAAIEQYRSALRRNPDNADAHVNWGNALVRAGRPADAAAHYAAAVAIRPDHADAQLNWGVALAMQGQLPSAILRFRRALELNPQLQTARDYLAQAEAQERAGKP